MREVDGFLYANECRGGYWRRPRHLLRAPKAAVRLGSATCWNIPAPGGADAQVTSTTCVDTPDGRVLAVRQLHAGDSRWQAISVSGVFLPTSAWPVEHVLALEPMLAVTAAQIQAEQAEFRGWPRPLVRAVPSLGLVPPGLLTLGVVLPPGVAADAGAARAARSAARVLESGRRVAVISDSAVLRRAVIAGALGLLPVVHPAHGSWSSLEGEAGVGLILIGVDPALWTGASPVAHGYVEVRIGPAGAEPPAGPAGVEEPGRDPVPGDPVPGDPGGDPVPGDPVPVDRLPEDPAPPGGRLCPACGRRAIRTAVVRLPGRALLERAGRDPRWVRAVAALREHQCAACGVRLQRSEAIPVVLVGGRRAGAEWVSRAVCGSQMSSEPPYLESRGVFRRVGPWDACEIQVRAGARRAGLLALAADPSAGWHDWLARVAGGMHMGVVCLVGPASRVGGTSPRERTWGERRPALVTEQAVIERTLSAALRGASGWEVLRPTGTDEPYSTIVDWLRRSDVL